MMIYELWYVLYWYGFMILWSEYMFVYFCSYTLLQYCMVLLYFTHSIVIGFAAFDSWLQKAFHYLSVFICIYATSILVSSIHSLQPALRAVLAADRKTGSFCQAQKCLQFKGPIIQNWLISCSYVQWFLLACCLSSKKRLSSPQEAADEVFTKEEGESNDAEEPTL